MKIVDPTYFLQDNDEEKDFAFYGCANVTIFARRREDLPVINRIGDVIRIHRANMKMYDGKKQFQVNVFYNSSWCLFSADLENPEEVNSKVKSKDSDDEMVTSKKKQLMPYKYSGKSFSIDPDALEQLQDIREWSKKYFADNDVIPDSMYTKLNE